MYKRQTLDPAAAYAKGTVSMSIMGQEETQETESYTVIEDGEMVTYTLANGQWMKSVSEEADSDMLNLSLYEAIADGDLEVEMDEDFASVNDKDAYVLRVNLSGDDLKDFIDTSMDSTGMLDDDEIEMCIRDRRSPGIPQITTGAPGVMMREVEFSSPCIIRLLTGARDGRQASAQMRQLSEWKLTSQMEAFRKGWHRQVLTRSC